MRCCVPNCASNKLKPNKSKDKGITYHEFPEDSQTRSRWIRALRLGIWIPNAGSVVCSQHFNDDEFVQTELCALDKDVEDVPVTFEMFQLCRMCLCSDTKVYNIGDKEIAQQYELLTGSEDCVGDILPQHICWECKSRLASFARLRSVALRSLQLLQEFYETVNSEATQDLRLIIDRETNKLTSTLVQSKTELVDCPPNGGSDIKPYNAASSSLVNRNDNSKSANKSKLLEKEEKGTKVLNENDNSGFNNVNHHMKSRTMVSKASIERGNIRENENDNSDYDDENDNFENFADDTDDTLEAYITDKTACQKTDTVDYNSGLEDMIYDSDSSKSDNDDIKRKLNFDLSKIYRIFDFNKLTLISQKINDDTNNENDEIAFYKNPRIYKAIKKTFHVKELSKDEQFKEFLRSKESDNYKNARLKCDICYRGFTRKKAYDLHKITHTDAYGPLKCPVCGIHYKLLRHLRQHLKESHRNSYSCKMCDYVTCALREAKLHLNFHQGTIYKCPQCDKTFQKTSSWFSHIRIHHPSQIVCRLCGFSYVSERGLRSHTAIKHKQKLETLVVPEDGPRCVECDIQFCTDAALTTHYRESNKNNNLLAEEQSRKRGASSDSKAVYTDPPKAKQVIKNKGPVTCEVCNIELPNQTKYRWHFKQLHPDIVQTKYPGTSMCEVCGLFYSCQAVLEKHKQFIHADVRKMYSCQQCGKKLTTKYSLYLHKETHLNKRTRYSCDICKKTFSSYSNLYKHKIIHKNLEFGCDICGKSFKHPQNRRSHITYVHLKKPLPERRNRLRVKKGDKHSAESLQSMEEETINHD